jgi:hypothetical protein
VLSCCLSVQQHSSTGVGDELLASSIVHIVCAAQHDICLLAHLNTNIPTHTHIYIHTHIHTHTHTHTHIHTHTHAYTHTHNKRHTHTTNDTHTHTTKDTHTHNKRHTHTYTYTHIHIHIRIHIRILPDPCRPALPLSFPANKPPPTASSGTSPTT